MRCFLLIVLTALLMRAASPASAQRRPPSRADSATRADTAVVPLAGLEVLVSLAPAVGGPGVGSGVPGRFVTLAGRQGSAFGLVVDALDDLPGVSGYDDLGSPFKRTLVLRGFTASPVVGLPQGVTVFLDGVPMNEPGAGEVNFELLPLEQLERIEVLSGTATLLGPNSLGGAVNLVTRRGGAGSGGEIELAVGSYDALGGSGSMGGRIGAWDYSVGGGHERSAGWRDRMRSDRSTLYASAGRFGDGSGVRVQLLGARSYAETAGSLPLSVYLARPDSNLTSGDFEDLWQVHASAAGYTSLGGGTGSLRLFARASGGERFNVNQAADPDVRGFSDSRTLGADADWRRELRLGNGTVGLRAGAGGLVNATEVQIHAERIDPGQTTDVHSPIRRLDGYLFGEYGIGPVSASLGLRYDHVRIPFRNRLDPARDTVSTYAQWNPRGGVSVRLGRGAFLYASLGRGFRAPALIELACADPEQPCPLPFALGDDPPLAPVIATTYEAGASWTGATASLNASAYRTDVRDDIFLLPYEDEGEPEGSTIDGYFANLPRTRRTGLELRGVLEARAGVRLDVAYGYTLATFQTDGLEIFSIREESGAENEIESGDRFPLVPDHTVAIGATITPVRGFDAGANVRYTGERVLRGDEANEEPTLDGYWVADLRLSYAVADWALEAVVGNVLDAAYFSFGTFNINQGAGRTLERFVTPGTPRRFELTLRRLFRH